MRWPSSEAVLERARAWAQRQAGANPDLEAVGVFGSYGRGEAGVGSDLDLPLILHSCDHPVWERLRRWHPAFAAVLGRDVRWLVGSGR